MRRSGTRRVVLVVGRQRLRDAVAGEQLGADAGVLAGDHVGRGQQAKRAQADVLGIPDRRRHQVEAGVEGRRGLGGVVAGTVAVDACG